jgi:predicted small metal-binding protein
MGKILHCRDLGPACDFVARGTNEKEVLERAAEHAKNDHGLSEISPQMAERLRAAIRDETA